MAIFQVSRRTLTFFLSLAILLGGEAGGARAETDAPLFYEALAPYGKWVVYGELGPVWFPAGVPSQWRPYVDGRWVPTPWGWVFETEEPWGWATYHFGHWLPTLDFGWVWRPGRTWYPSTVVWCSNRDYIGWAPMPPPFYTPPPAFGGGAFLIGGDPFAVLTPYLWTLCPVTQFLRGWGTFWAPAHSFLRCGCLVPVSGVAVLLPQMAPVASFFVLGPRPGGSFAFGPDFHFLSQSAAVPVHELEREARRVSPLRIRQLLPPAAMVEKYPHLREMVPEALLRGQPLAVAPVTDTQAAAATFLKAEVAPRLTRLPALPADLPRAVTVPFATRTGPEALRGVKGAELPATAIDPRLAPPPPAPQAESPATVHPAETSLPAPKDLSPRPPEASHLGGQRRALPGPAPEVRGEPDVRGSPKMPEAPPADVSLKGARAPSGPPPAAGAVPAAPPVSAAPPRPTFSPGEKGPELQAAPRPEGEGYREPRLREHRERQLRQELERQRRLGPTAPPVVRERPTTLPAPVRPKPGPEAGGRPGPPAGFPAGRIPGLSPGR